MSDAHEKDRHHWARSNIVDLASWILMITCSTFLHAWAIDIFKTHARHVHCSKSPFDHSTVKVSWRLAPSSDLPLVSNYASWRSSGKDKHWKVGRERQRPSVAPAIPKASPLFSMLARTDVLKICGSWKWDKARERHADVLKLWIGSPA
jgi:hypothetical protein